MHNSVVGVKPGGCQCKYILSLKYVFLLLRQTTFLGTINNCNCFKFVAIFKVLPPDMKMVLGTLIVYLLNSSIITGVAVWV